MKKIHSIVVVSPLTKKRLEVMKKTDKKTGLRSTLGGIIDRLVANEYEQRKEAELV